ncbi:hypothetical protein D3C81_911150 [compost metagenome]
MLASSGSDFISQYWRARLFWFGLTARFEDEGIGCAGMAHARAQRKKAMVQKTTAFLGVPASAAGSAS